MSAETISRSEASGSDTKGFMIMAKHDISFEQDGTEVIVRITTNLPHGDGGTSSFPCTFDCGTFYAARLLCDYLRDRHDKAIQQIRKAEYNDGWEAAKSHKRRKSTYFSSDMAQKAANYH